MYSLKNLNNQHFILYFNASKLSTCDMIEPYYVGPVLYKVYNHNEDWNQYDLVLTSLSIGQNL